MTYHDVQTVATAEHLFVIVCQSVGISPVFVVYVGQIGLRQTSVAKLGIGRCLIAPHLIGIVKLPTITKFAAELPSLERLPIDTHVVVLTETALLLVGRLYTFQRIVTGIGTVLVILRVFVQCFDWRVGNSSGHQRISLGFFIILTSAQTINLLLRQAGIEIECEPLVDFSIQLGIDIVLRVTRPIHDALLVVAGITDIELGGLATTAHADIVLLLVACTTEEFVLPVVTFHRFPDFQILVCAIRCTRLVQFILIECIVIRIEHSNLFGSLTYTIGYSEIDLRLAFSTRLGSDDNDAIGTTGTIDGSRRSILQYIHRLDVSRSDVTDAGYREAVDNIERRIVLRKRATATNADFHIGIRRSFRSGNLHTCHFSLQGFRCIRYGYRLQLFGTDGRYRTCQVLLLYRTIADYNHLFQGL